MSAVVVIALLEGADDLALPGGLYPLSALPFRPGPITQGTREFKAGAKGTTSCIPTHPSAQRLTRDLVPILRAHQYPRDHAGSANSSPLPLHPGIRPPRSESGHCST